MLLFSVSFVRIRRRSYIWPLGLATGAVHVWPESAQVNAVLMLVVCLLEDGRGAAYIDGSCGDMSNIAASVILFQCCGLSSCGLSRMFLSEIRARRWSN